MKKIYHTKQKELIQNALAEMGNEHITAEAVAAALKAKGEDVGIATVYRNLDKLVNEGVAMRYSLPGSASACYQAVHSGKAHVPHCHAICTACGEVSHLNCDEIDSFAEHLAQHHSFKVDKQNTVFFGLCQNCEKHG